LGKNHIKFAIKPVIICSAGIVGIFSLLTTNFAFHLPLVVVALGFMFFFLENI